MTTPAVIAGHEQALAMLCRHFGVQKLELFGSGSKPELMHDESDLDFIVTFDGTAIEGAADAFFGLKEGLEKLFARPVDLLTAGSIRNPFLRQQIDKERVVVYPLP